MEYNDLVRSLRQCGRWQGEVRSVGRETQCKGCAYHDAENDVCKSWDWKTKEEHIMLDAADAIEKLQKKIAEWQEDACKWNNEYYALLDSQPKWISVKDCLPNVEEDVIVAVLTSIRGKRIRTVTTDYINTAGKWDAASCDWRHEVTHWMPLPEPPDYA